MSEILRIGLPDVELKTPLKNQEPIIEFSRVDKSYNGHIALKDINIKISPGEFVCLVGQSGVGKTTLIKLLIKQEEPTRGLVLVATRSLKDLRPREVPIYRRKIGVVFQDFKLLPQLTVWENIAFALEVCGVSTSEVAKRTEKVVDLVGLNRSKRRYPEEISGGERQRCAIARALVHSPKLLIADEPTGNLDPVNTWEIVELLYRINQRGTTILLASHNRQVVDRINRRVILMKAGSIVSDQQSGKYVI